MADSKEKYPKVARTIWWALRDRFKKSLPSLVTPMFVISVSNMSEDSARSNVINPIRQIGLIDDDGKPTELGTRWRNDDEYTAVCHEIRKKLYPAELLEAFPDGTGNEEAIRNWFMKKALVGEAAAKMFARTYLLLSEADLSKREESPARPAAAQNPEKTPKLSARAAAKTAKESEIHESKSAPAPQQITGKLPSIHIDVQVHISPDTTPEQIDKIFESMAKHLSSFSK